MSHIVVIFVVLEQDHRKQRSLVDVTNLEHMNSHLRSCLQEIMLRAGAAEWGQQPEEFQKLIRVSCVF